MIHKWFDGELKEARETVVAEPEVGLGPLHTTYDGKGNAYTTLFLDSQVVKWNIDAAIKAFKGDKNAKVVLDRIDCHYQPGHLNASMAETREADGRWLVVGSKFSKDRYLPVGPLHDENEQLFDISGEKMKLLADHPAHPEPHDFIIVKREKIKTRQVYAVSDFPNAVKEFKDSKVERKGNKVTVLLTAGAPQFSLPDFKVKRGDEVTIVLTNLDKIEDLSHGIGIEKYNVNFIVNPGETRSVTFKADKLGYATAPISATPCTSRCAAGCWSRPDAQRRLFSDRIDGKSRAASMWTSGSASIRTALALLGGADRRVRARVGDRRLARQSCRRSLLPTRTSVLTRRARQ